ncbi:MAG: glycosyltransferase family 2 protein [Flavobacteriales bacterium]|nr:glycosyltransferase family 2 protein [Flavobacteriales bacterium]
MKVSVIIPTINRYDDLKESIKCLLKQDFKEFEIIIIDQTEGGDSNSLGEYHKNELIKYYRSDIKSASASRNIGIGIAEGVVLLFIDDDVIIEDKKFLQNHFRHYADELIHGVVGCPLEKQLNQKVRYERHWMSYRDQEVAWLYFPSNYGCNTYVAVGRSNNLSVRRTSAIEVGGMDENYERGAHREEADFCLRLTRKFGPLFFDPNARLIHVGNKQGGIRSWNDSQFVKAEHNVVGAIYFDLKIAHLKYKLEFHLATLRYFVLNKVILSRPGLYLIVLKRLIKSYKIARGNLKNGAINFKS